MLKWIYKPSGNCPVQAEGYFMGKFFYFRSRGSRTTIEFANSIEDWNNDKILKYYLLKVSQWPEAGWFSKRYCYLLIFKGLMMFLLGFKTTEEKDENIDFGF